MRRSRPFNRSARQKRTPLPPGRTKIAFSFSTASFPSGISGSSNSSFRATLTSFPKPPTISIGSGVPYSFRASGSSSHVGATLSGQIPAAEVSASPVRKVQAQYFFRIFLNLYLLIPCHRKLASAGNPSESGGAAVSRASI